MKAKQQSFVAFQLQDAILANNREDNKGGSNVTRYRKDPIKHKGVDIFVSFQWKATDKSKIISWFKKHQGQAEIGELTLLSVFKGYR